MAISRSIYIFGDLLGLLSTAWRGVLSVFVIVPRMIDDWLEASLYLPLEFRETWLFRHLIRMQTATARIRLNISMLTAYWLRQHRRHAKRKSVWRDIETPIGVY